MAHADPPLNAAIDWMVLLRSGEATADDRARHRRWHDADPRHAQAWARVSGAVERSVSPLRSLADAPAVAARGALMRPARRRVLGTGLAAVGTLLVGGWLVQRQWPVGELLADVRTGVGERRRLVLDDGSALLLNACSAVDLRFDGTRRLVQLHAGELNVQVAPDPGRPFLVRSAQGEVQALGTRFVVRQEEDCTFAAVLEHSVRLRTAAGDERVLQHGQAARFDAAQVRPTEAVDSGVADWQRGLLSVNDRLLAEVVEALRAYRHGFIRVSPKAAQLRVLGAFPLDEPDRALDSLAQTLPLRVTRYGDWLVTIDLRT